MPDAGVAFRPIRDAFRAHFVPISRDEGIDKTALISFGCHSCSLLEQALRRYSARRLPRGDEAFQRRQTQQENRFPEQRRGAAHGTVPAMARGANKRRQRDQGMASAYRSTPFAFFRLNWIKLSVFALHILAVTLESLARSFRIVSWKPCFRPTLYRRFAKVPGAPTFLFGIGEGCDSGLGCNEQRNNKKRHLGHNPLGMPNKINREEYKHDQRS